MTNEELCWLVRKREYSVLRGELIGGFCENDFAAGNLVLVICEYGGLTSPITAHEMTDGLQIPTYYLWGGIYSGSKDNYVFDDCTEVINGIMHVAVLLSELGQQRCSMALSKLRLYSLFEDERDVFNFYRRIWHEKR